MTREEIDILWQHALQDSVRDGEQFTRYHFAALVAERAAAEERAKYVQWPQLETWDSQKDRREGA